MERGPEPLLVTRAEAERVLGCRTSKLYALEKLRDAEGRPLLPTRKLGKLTMFEWAGLKAFVAGLPRARGGA
ncbi:hypothetical protein [Plastoroseomonas hellenica]|uniref:hypothetical protein n=1 Tax=Plastoroseomonas hellenica TaxID=2687306 RepID=UPI001BA70931|nr:hypothetical protein [Plastoroseomonas hellenica]MBR0647925.1 hypothetical protein [Plastoroseomonas hellenica]